MIKSFRLKSKYGDEIHISNYGARITKWLVLVDGETRNIVLGYDTEEEYLTDANYLGAIVGPYANRIANSKHVINSQVVKLDANEGKHHLHGGANSISDHYWLCEEHNSDRLVLSCTISDGFNGYPGPITFLVTYEIVETTSTTYSLNISINVSSKSLTIAGPTAHPYFNLSGRRTTIESHELMINSHSIAEVDRYNIPTGKIQDVEQTIYDYRTSRLIDLNVGKSSIDNSYFIQKGLSKKCIPHASVTSPDQKLLLNVESNYPSLQVYFAEHIREPFMSCQGLCLEPQFTPDSPNKEAFPFRYTAPDSPFNTEIHYQLTKL